MAVAICDGPNVLLWVDLHLVHPTLTFLFWTRLYDYCPPATWLADWLTVNVCFRTAED